MAANEISLTIKLDEDDWKAIERAVMSIEKRLERVEAILDARGLDWDHPRVASDHFADANKMVAEEPKKQATKKWRILEPGEVIKQGDWVCSKSLPSCNDPVNGHGWMMTVCVGLPVLESDGGVYARPFAEEPAKEPVPAWEPKVGDWVKVTRPVDWIEWEHPRWGGAMHEFDGRVGQIERESEGHFYIRGFAAWNGFRYQFHRDWLSPAEPPASEKTPEPEYREPVLPADVGKECEFSDDSISWEEDDLIGWRANLNTFNWESARDSYRYARIKKDA